MSLHAVVVVVVFAITTGVGVAIVGLAVIETLAERSRRSANRRLEAMQQRVLHTAIELSNETRAEGWEARLRLIRAANLAMGESTDR